MAKFTEDDLEKVTDVCDGDRITLELLAQLLADERAATIERCAWECDLEEMRVDRPRDCAARIRALREL